MKAKEVNPCLKYIVQFDYSSEDTSDNPAMLYFDKILALVRYYNINNKFETSIILIHSREIGEHLYPLL